MMVFKITNFTMSCTIHQHDHGVLKQRQAILNSVTIRLQILVNAKPRTNNCKPNNHVETSK